MIPPSWRRDWHQFRLLSRDAVRQLIDAALFSRESDPAEYALWMLALIATPPAFFAMRQVMAYTALVNAPVDVVQQLALGHRLFFVTYGMLASTLLAALTWEALFPDGRDQEIIGVLPVRPYTYAAARLGAALKLGAGFAAAVNLPAALIYTMMSAGHPIFQSVIPQLIVGHIVATMCGSMFVFCALLAARGLTAMIFGARAGAWLGAVLQLATVILLVEVFFFLPAILGKIIKALLAGDPAANALPPAWFASVHTWMTGNSHPVVTAGAQIAMLSFAAATLLTVPVYLLPARWLGERALASRPRERTAGVTAIIRAVANVSGTSPPVRAIFLFTIASLLRSRRHLLVLATYFGAAIAVCLLSVFIVESRGDSKLSLNTPDWWMLALPMIVIFFLVLGLRASFRIPTEVEANWPFRVTPPTLADCVNATALVTFVLGVIPVLVLLTAITATAWPLATAGKALVVQTLAAWLLIECVLFYWSKVPFGCVHAPSAAVFKTWWPAYTIALYVFAFRLSAWQFAALSSGRAMALYLAALAIAIGVLRIQRRRRHRRIALEFDAPSSYTVERLNLSEALN